MDVLNSRMAESGTPPWLFRRLRQYYFHYYDAGVDFGVQQQARASPLISRGSHLRVLVRERERERDNLSLSLSARADPLGAYAPPSLPRASQVLNELSPPLRTELLMYLNKDMVTHIPFFSDQPPAFVVSVCSLLKPWCAAFTPSFP